MIQAAPATLEALSVSELLRWAIENFGRDFAIATSFQSEGMVLIDMAARISRDVRIFTLDTGRLPQETYDILEQVRGRYGVSVEVVCPEPDEVEGMVNRYGPNLFYGGLQYRRLCCEIRKVRPLNRKVGELRAWATGLRRTQAESRSQVEKIEHEGERLKLNPLADWTSAEVERYTLENDVPRHSLYSRGYTSIGCAPCTRATQGSEDERAGRWWWEAGSDKECGIHFTPEGKIERTVDVLLREIVQNA